MPATFDTSKIFRHAVPVLIGLLLLVRLIGMAVVPLMDTTEARYAEIGRKMVELNDWITPWFDYGVPYWGKPPLSFWATAISFKLFGVNEFTARLPHLIFSLAVIGIAMWLAGRRDRGAALPTVALIAGSFLYFITAGAVITDMELVLGTTLAMAGFWLALEHPDDAGSNTNKVKGRSRWLSGTMLFGGLIVGMLAKGPVALVLTGVPLFLWTAYNRRWLDAWRKVPWVRGALLTLLISLPWYWMAERHTPGFLQYFLVDEHWHRFLTAGWEGDRYGTEHSFPIGSIWLFAYIDFLPWPLLLPFAFWCWRKSATSPTSTTPATSGERAWQGYLLAWAIAPLLFFTAARNIIMTYVLPGLPAAAVLAAGWLARQHRQGHETERWLAAGLLITLMTMCGFALNDLSQPDKMARKSLKALLAAYDQVSGRTATLAAARSPAKETTSSDVPIIFVWYRPFSAEFYSRGRAIEAADDNEAWRRIGPGAAYVATARAELFIADAAKDVGGSSNKRAADGAVAKVTRTVTRVGRYGVYDLLFVAPL